MIRGLLAYKSLAWLEVSLKYLTYKKYIEVDRIWSKSAAFCYESACEKI
jgi:hypothetical protein